MPKSFCIYDNKPYIGHFNNGSNYNYFHLINSNEFFCLLNSLVSIKSLFNNNTLS